MNAVYQACFGRIDQMYSLQAWGAIKDAKPALNNGIILHWILSVGRDQMMVRGKNSRVIHVSEQIHDVIVDFMYGI